MDAGFMKRVYKTSIAVWLFGLLWCAALKNLHVAIGMTIGFGIGLGSLMLLEQLTQALFTPEAVEQQRKPVRWLLVIAALKYAVIGFILWASLKSRWVSPIGLAIGIGLPQMVIFLKALGRALDFGEVRRS